MRGTHAKLAISVALDLLDFTIGRVPGFEFLFDLAMTVASVALWGWSGLFALWEIADPTGQIDAFIPTLTIVALIHLMKKPPRGEAGGRRKD